MSWVLLAVGAYFFSALSQMFDKALLRVRIPSAAAYAFYSGITSIFVVVLLPFVRRLADLFLPFSTLMLAFAAGSAFVAALYFLYVSLRRCDVSRIAPLVGGAVPIFLLVLAVSIRGVALSLMDFVAISFFIAGGFILATEVERNDKSHDSIAVHFLGISGRRLALCKYESRNGILAAVAAAFFFAITFFLSKEVFNSPSPFVPEFFWMRIGSVLAALVMLVIPWLRRDIFETSPRVSRSSAGMFFGNKIIGAASFLLLNLAFNIADSQTYVIIINALKGVEHFFVFIFSIGFTLFLPHILREDFDRHTLILKSIGVLFIAVGFWYLS